MVHLDQLTANVLFGSAHSNNGSFGSAHCKNGSFGSCQLTAKIVHLDHVSSQQKWFIGISWLCCSEMMFCLFDRVNDLKERLEQVEQENRQSQETISFKDSELEVLSLYSFFGGEESLRWFCHYCEVSVCFYATNHLAFSYWKVDVGSLACPTITVCGVYTKQRRDRHRWVWIWFQIL